MRFALEAFAVRAASEKRWRATALQNGLGVAVIEYADATRLALGGMRFALGDRGGGDVGFVVTAFVVEAGNS
jgi:hypothetical protein